MSEAILDASPLIHLAELNALDVLSDFASLLIPDTVWKEVERYQPTALNHPGLALHYVPTPVAYNNLQVLAQAFSLSQGEVEALALLPDHPGAMFLTDDAAARLVAEQLGFRVHGTIGLLIRSARQGLRSHEDILHLLQNLPGISTLYIRPSFLREIIEQLEGEWQ